MSLSRFNHEGYHDPTPYEALGNIERETKRTTFRPVVYICSPYAGDVEHNVQNAQEYCRFAVSQNCIPIAPHLLFPQFMDENDPGQRDLALFMGLVLMTKCAEVWVFGRCVSKGMAAEIMKAETRNQPVRYFGEDCREVGT